jgi:hypothetical protein
MRISARYLRRLIREAIGPTPEEILLTVYTSAAHEGMKIVVKGQKGSLYAGIGNTEGLHGYADELSREKWGKSGMGFIKKLKQLQPGAALQAIETGRGGKHVEDIGVWTPELQARVAEINTVTDLKRAVDEDWG